MSKVAKESKDPVEASREILAYMQTQNRPYSVTDVLNNLHKKFGKALVTKTFESLTSEGKVKEKTYGKQKVYVISQDDIPIADNAELQSMDNEIETLNVQKREIQKEILELSSQYKTLSSALSLSELKAATSNLINECKTKEEKLSRLKEGQVFISKEEKEKVLKCRNVNVREWRKRKRLANDIFDAILEGYPKPKKTLFEEVGVETDEDYNVKIPDK